MEQQQRPDTHIEKLIRLVDTLRGENGCPWDRKQTTGSVSRYLVEEAYEVVDALAADDPEEVCQELGDLLFQILFVTKLYEEKGAFSFRDVVDGIHEKMVRRHPHVFGDVRLEGPDDGAEQVIANWRRIKAREKSQKSRVSALDGIPRHLPPLARAVKMLKKINQSPYQVSGNRIAAGENNGEGQTVGRDLLSIVAAAGRDGVDPEMALSTALKELEKAFRKEEDLSES